jgi:hypothetical protein
MQHVKVAYGLGLAVSFCMAQTFSISGTVIDSLNSPPYPGATTNLGIAGASVTLKAAGKTTTTDLSGNFTLTDQSTDVSSASQAIVPSTVPVLTAKGEIQLSLPKAARVAIKTYSAQGKQLGVLERTLAAGNHTIMPVRTNSGVYVYQVVVNGETYTLQQTNIQGRTYARRSDGNGTVTHGMAKGLAFPDSLIVSKAWYCSQSKYITNTTTTGATFRLKAFPTNSPLVTCQSAGVQANEFYIYSNLWNTAVSWSNSCPIATAGYCNSVCLYSSQNSQTYNYYIINMNDDAHNGNCKSYNAIQKNYNPKLDISTLQACNVTFAESSPHGVSMNYEVAFDVWVPLDAPSVEFMIWVDNWHQTPSGTKQNTTPFTLDGHQYNLYRSANNDGSQTINYVPTVPYSSGTQNIKLFFDDAINRGWVSAHAGLQQLDFGFEMVSTNHYNSGFVISNYTLNEVY